MRETEPHKSSHSSCLGRRDPSLGGLIISLVFLWPGCSLGVDQGTGRVSESAGFVSGTVQAM